MKRTFIKLLFFTLILSSCGLFSIRDPYSSRVIVENQSRYEIIAESELREGSFEDACDPLGERKEQKIAPKSSATLEVKVKCRYEPRRRSIIQVLNPTANQPNLWTGIVSRGRFKLKDSFAPSTEFYVENDGVREEIKFSTEDLNLPQTQDLDKVALPISVSLKPDMFARQKLPQTNILLKSNENNGQYLRLFLTTPTQKTRVGVPTDALTCEEDSYEKDENYCFKNHTSENGITWLEVSPYRYGTSLLYINRNVPLKIQCNEESCRLDQI